MEVYDEKMEYNEFKRIQKLWKEEKNISRAIYRITKCYGKISFADARNILVSMNDNNHGGISLHDCWNAMIDVYNAKWITLEKMEKQFITMSFTSFDYYLIDNKR